MVKDNIIYINKRNKRFTNLENIYVYKHLVMAKWNT